MNEARAQMGRAPISVRWVEVNKGDDRSPNIRSRLVAREIRTAGQDTISAPTPATGVVENDPQHGYHEVCGW